jgi:E3 ubiquitin-protein ligase UBR2
MRLAPIATLVLEWSNTDRIVFIKTVRMVLKALREETSIEKDLPPMVSHSVCGHTVGCIDYVVSKRPVSIHWPLSRLLAGLNLQMASFDLTLDSSELNVGERPGMAQLVEPALRTCVFMAQVQAGMWRRNGMNKTFKT